MISARKWDFGYQAVAIAEPELTSERDVRLEVKAAARFGPERAVGGIVLNRVIAVRSTVRPDCNRVVVVEPCDGVRLEPQLEAIRHWRGQDVGADYPAQPRGET